MSRLICENLTKVILLIISLCRLGQLGFQTFAFNGDIFQSVRVCTLQSFRDQLPRLGERELICLLLFTCNYVVSVWRDFLFLWVLGMGYVILL